MLSSLFETFRTKKKEEKIYVIIDEYDHFANELLGFRTDDFKEIVSRNGKVRKWYEMLKKGTETVVDRIFITGVAPITLDSTTSGFNIASDLTRDIEFNDMLGFSEEDVKYLMREIEIAEEKQKELLPIIKQSYDGYVFSDLAEGDIEECRMYNSNMTLYFLNKYYRFQKVPDKLIDTNVISDYKKIEGFMNLCGSEGKNEILEKIVAGETVESELTEKFNAEIEFGEKELVSLLYYLGYLTIKENEFGMLKFGSPNEVIRGTYAEYFLKYLNDITGITKRFEYIELLKEMFFEGKIERLNDIVKEYLTNLSNRDYRRFDEKYVKIIYYSICKMLGALTVKSELEVGGKYADILLIPREKIEERYGVLIEFKYIKKEDYEKDKSLLEQKQKEAREQLEKYKNTEEIKMIPKLKCYSVVVIKDEIIVEEN